jgi:hypothetical protein
LLVESRWQQCVSDPCVYIFRTECPRLRHDRPLR